MRASSLGSPLKSANKSGWTSVPVTTPPGLPVPALPAQVVDERLRVDLLLDVERRRLHDEVGPILRVLAAPDELRVKVSVAPLVGDLDRLCSARCITDRNSAWGCSCATPPRA